MEFSYRYVNTMVNAFRDTLDTGIDVESRFVTLSRNNALSKSMVLDISNLTSIEVPAYMRSIFESTIKERRRNPVLHPENKIVVPMYVNCMTLNKRTSDAILTEFYIRTTFDQRLKKVITNKGEVYYGNRGIILNKDFVPLIMHTLVCKKVDERNFIYTKLVLHVHPSVFLSNGLIEKSIIKKIIPFYVTNRVPSVYCYCSGFTDNLESHQPTIVIDDMSNFISTPIVPNISDTEESLNKCIEDNIDEILNNL